MIPLIPCRGGSRSNARSIRCGTRNPNTGATSASPSKSGVPSTASRSNACWYQHVVPARVSLFPVSSRSSQRSSSGGGATRLAMRTRQSSSNRLGRSIGSGIWSSASGSSAARNVSATRSLSSGQRDRRATWTHRRSCSTVTCASRSCEATASKDCLAGAGKASPNRAAYGAHSAAIHRIHPRSAACSSSPSPTADERNTYSACGPTGPRARVCPQSIAPSGRSLSFNRGLNVRSRSLAARMTSTHLDDSVPSMLGYRFPSKIHQRRIGTCESRCVCGTASEMDC